jgi:hypothetical protein
VSTIQNGTFLTITQGVDVEYRLNGSGSWFQFDNDLTDNSGSQVEQELVPLVSVQNIKSLQLKFSGTASNTFEINNISIIYRMKNPK